MSLFIGKCSCMAFWWLFDRMYVGLLDMFLTKDQMAFMFFVSFLKDDMMDDDMAEIS